jgi:type I restriction enzyme S subunit
VSLRFTGEIEQRDLHGKKEFKGPLFFARAGDIIYSKIDVRNGAIGIVPAEVPIATVTSEFPVYRIKKDVTLSEYVQLVFRTEHFRRIINGMVSGTSGRKRVQPDDLENVQIPLPTLAEQKAIVARWRKAQDEIAAARRRGEILQSELQRQTRKTLGIAEKNEVRLPKVFGLQWRELARWSVEFLGRQVVGLADTETGKYPAHSLSSICEGVSGGTPPTRNEAYWRGNIPWVSPKDMKTAELFDAQDHVSQMAVDEVVPLVPANSILVVVRSGILQRTVPIAVNRVPVSINQDIRAFIPRRSQQVLPGFLAAYLDAQQQNLLRLVKWSTTVQSINKEELEAFPVPLPPIAVQNKIVADVSAQKKEIARERETADILAKKTSVEIEALILGAKPLEEK